MLTARLDQLVATADEDTLRTMGEVGCRLAVTTVRLDAPEVEAAVGALIARRYGDTPERRALRVIVDRLDDAAFAAAAAAEEEYAAAFARARAATAVWSALDANAKRAAQDALYEALHAVEGADELERTVLAAIGPLPDA